MTMTVTLAAVQRFEVTAVTGAGEPVGAVWAGFCPDLKAGAVAAALAAVWSPESGARAVRVVTSTPTGSGRPFRTVNILKG
jgi:hypothetical protein